MERNIKLCKSGIPAQPLFPSGDMDSYEMGKPNERVSLPVAYELTGTLVEEPVVGKRLIVRRSSRNGVFISGDFLSSTITKIDGNQIHTQNSIYTLTDLKA